MNKLMTAGKAARAAMLTALVLVEFSGWATVAAAQPYDHLKCFKIKDSIDQFAAIANLMPADTGNFAVDSSCTIKVRSRELCIPIAKDRTDAGPALAVDGQDLTNAFLCYAVKCPSEVLPESLLMSDQFGSRNLAKLHTTRVCAPAVVGIPPTTTTTLPAGNPRACTNATPPACDGTCADYAFACVPDQSGTACMCSGVDIFFPCGILAPAPDCYGVCDGSSSCIDAGGGACQCALVFE